MARLTESDKAQLRELTRRGWRQPAAGCDPAQAEPTLAARERYCRWAAHAAHFFKGVKPVRFDGSNWRL
jgi:hypothetical protein